MRSLSSTDRDRDHHHRQTEVGGPDTRGKSKAAAPLHSPITPAASRATFHPAILPLTSSCVNLVLAMSPESSSSGSYRPTPPTLSRANSYGSAYSSAEVLDGPDLLLSAPSGMPLADLLETYVNPRLDWAERRVRPYVNDVKVRARLRREDLVKRARSKQEIKSMEKELKRLRSKVSRKYCRVSLTCTARADCVYYPS